MFPAKIDFPLTGLDWLEWYGAHRVHHPGIDFNTGYGNQDLGNDVVCPKTGFVEFIYTGWNHGGFGNFVIIHHTDGNYTRYAHLQKDVKVKMGDEVRAGDLIGFVGNSGTTYAHLHFEVFTEDMADIQKAHWKKWRWYPSGKTKNWVMAHYVNPWEWLKKNSPSEFDVGVEKYLAKYIKDVPAFLKEFNQHKWIEFIRRVDQGITLKKK